MELKLILSWILFVAIMMLLGQRLGRLIYRLSLVRIGGPNDLLGAYIIKIYILAMLIYKIAVVNFSISLVEVVFLIMILLPSGYAIYQRNGNTVDE